ncbi:MAG: hypothetical protein KJO42_14380 [Silicimonas sp.]|nr:hypothetical protein [Silicimonas sp.]MBT8426289.1 hypothetical protein [Silicimonas sp.]NND18777.1 hypothetical protein [Silicimonas sp.]NND41612.1 hypothetical protein [Silicimonas sp.]NNL73740.1 hypothetical protein [Silicimonas sp.]
MSEAFTDCVNLAKGELRRANQLLQEEIRSYPTPISGCDAQFNHLLAERQKIARAIGALETTVFVPNPRSPMPVSGIESR